MLLSTSPTKSGLGVYSGAALRITGGDGDGAGTLGAECRGRSAKAAGIGGASAGNINLDGEIEIAGGVVSGTCTAAEGTALGAGIGCGGNKNLRYRVIISGGTVFASCSGGAAAIGGSQLSPGHVTITGGRISAQATVPIGDGTQSGSVGTVTITGGAFADEGAVPGTGAAGSVYGQAPAEGYRVQASRVEGYPYEVVSASLPVRVTIEPAAFAFEVADQTLAPGSGLGDVEVPDGAEGVAGEQVAGTVAWYLDEAHEQPVPGDWALEGEPGSAQVLYWVFTPAEGQSNYVDEALSGSVTLTVGEPAPEEPEPGDPGDPSGEGESGEGSESDDGSGDARPVPAGDAIPATDDPTSGLPVVALALGVTALAAGRALRSREG